MMRKLIRKVKAHSKNTVRQVMDKCKLSYLILVKTTKCIFRKYERKECIAAKKTSLTKNHVKAKLSWSKGPELLDAYV